MLALVAYIFIASVTASDMKPYICCFSYKSAIKFRLIEKIILISYRISFIVTWSIIARSTVETGWSGTMWHELNIVLTHKFCALFSMREARREQIFGIIIDEPKLMSSPVSSRYFDLWHCFSSPAHSSVQAKISVRWTVWLLCWNVPAFVTVFNSPLWETLPSTWFVVLTIYTHTPPE